MHISATNNFQTKNNYNTNFTALNLGKKNSAITKEFRDLADKTVDIYEVIMKNPEELNKFKAKDCDASINKLFNRDYIKLNKKTPDGKITLIVSSEKPRQANIKMSIKSNAAHTEDDIFYNSNYNSVSVSSGNVKKEDVETFEAYKTTPTEIFGLDLQDALKSFKKHLSEFLNMFE